MYRVLELLAQLYGMRPTMFGRKPIAAVSPIPIAVCAVLVAWTAGCAAWRMPRIDPTGERFLIWPDEIRAPGILGPPVISTGPTPSPVPPAISSPGPPNAPTAETIPGQTPIPEPTAIAPGNVDAAPALPQADQSALFPNGICLPGFSSAPRFNWNPFDSMAPAPVLVGPLDAPNPCWDPCSPWLAPTLIGPIEAVPQPAMPPAAMPPPPSMPQPVDQIQLTPKRLLASVGSEVVLRAGICTQDGHLISNQKIEWLLANEGVGEFIAVGEPSWMHPLNRPKKINNHFAIGRTSGRSFAIDRGTPDPTDDVMIRDGETWISVTSPMEGSSLVTAVAPDIDSWNRRKTTATIHWIDAQWIFPKPAQVATGTQHMLTTTLTRRSTGAPIAGWQVRYEILDHGAAGFAPDGAEFVDATTDAAGRATVEIFQADPQVPSARIGIQVIRAPLPGTGERLVLGRGTTRVTWAKPDIAITTSGPNTATVESTVTFQIHVTNPGSATARDVSVAARVPAGMAYVESRPTPAGTGRQTEWNLGDIPPHGSQTIQAHYRIERAGSFEFCATVRTADGLQSEHCSRTEVPSAKAQLDMQLTGPQTATVGDVVPFEVVVTNRGSVTATGLIITDRFDSGLRSEHDTLGTGQIANRALGQLPPGSTSPPIRIELEVVTAGRQSHEVEVTADGGISVRRSATIEVRERATGPGDRFPNQPLPAGAAIDLSKECPRQARVGDTITMKIIAQNTGRIDLSNVEVEEVFPAELKPLPGTDGRVRDQQTLRWTLNRLPAGQRQVLIVEYECIAPTDLNAARTEATIRAGDLVQTSTAAVEILRRIAPPDPDTQEGPALGGPRPNIELTIAGPDWQVQIGEVASYPITIINKGLGSDHQLMLEVTFPPELAPDLDRTNENKQLRAKNIQVSQLNQTVRFTPIREIRPGEPIQLTLFFKAQQAGLATIRANLMSNSLTQPLTVDKETTIVPR